MPYSLRLVRSPGGSGNSVESGKSSYFPHISFAISLNFDGPSLIQES
jgi:hypothetical protein